MKKYSLEQERELGRGAFTEQVVVPLVQCGIVGLVLALGVLTFWVVLAGDWRGWPVAAVAGVLAFAALTAWRFIWEVRRPVLDWLETLTGQDIDGDGVVGTTGRVTFTEARLDRLARQVLRLASEGKSISRRSLVTRMMSRGEWEALMRRLVARGICDKARDGSAVLRYSTFAEAWERYTAPRQSTQYWVDEEGGLVSKE